MEDFYSNPFRQEEEEDALCYADVGVAPSRLHETSATVVAEEIYKDTPAASSPAAGSDILGITSALRYQSQLTEALRANSSLRATYETHIETQRHEIDRLSAENTSLSSKLTKLESEMRALSLEKDCAAMAYKREVEKNVALEEKIVSLEADLNSVERRAKELAVAYSRTPRQKAPYAPNCSTPPQRNGESLLQTPKSLQRGLDNSFDAPLSRPTSRPGTTVQRAAVNMQTQPQHGASHMYAQQQQQQRDKGAAGLETRRDSSVDVAMIQQLERQLTQQNQARDEIERQLQKMENMRLRTVAERSRKLALERDLEAAQRTVGELRRRLRALAALTR